MPKRRRAPTADALDQVIAYHERSKHHFQRFAEALGYLDWASQPDPFRTYRGATRTPLPRRVLSAPVAFDRLYDGAGIRAEPVTLDALADFLRQSLALSAWKQAQQARWALRVNPSSGNLHPTEGYLVLPSIEELGAAGVFHYAPRDHALERRATVSAEVWQRVLPGLAGGAFLVGLGSIVWREAWKYGERAFRYCQHDAGHALAALALSAVLQGWRLRLLPHWSHAAVAAVLGLDRSRDFTAGEGEDAELLAVVAPAATAVVLPEPDEAALGKWRASLWVGVAEHLSRDHHEWPALAPVAAATDKPATPDHDATVPEAWPAPADLAPPPDARTIVQQRRSAVALDGKSSIALGSFVRMLQRTLPGPWAPFAAWPFAAEVNLLLFVHRVDGLAPGVYFLARSARGAEQVRALARPSLLWQRPDGVPDALPLTLLEPGGCCDLARAVSCHQDIAADGFFALGMIARFAPALRERGAWFYRHLFWETGMIGQVLYLEAEAAGVRSTGIGCFFDDPVHQVLGLEGNEFQSLYHFTVGVPVEDVRLTTEPGYGET